MTAVKSAPMTGSSAVVLNLKNFSPCKHVIHDVRSVEAVRRLVSKTRDEVMADRVDGVELEIHIKLQLLLVRRSLDNDELIGLLAAAAEDIVILCDRLLEKHPTSARNMYYFILKKSTTTTTTQIKNQLTNNKLKHTSTTNQTK